jgi:hypothetical protein
MAEPQLPWGMETKISLYISAGLQKSKQGRKSEGRQDRELPSRVAPAIEQVCPNCQINSYASAEL